MNKVNCTVMDSSKFANCFDCFCFKFRRSAFRPCRKTIAFFLFSSLYSARTGFIVFCVNQYRTSKRCCSLYNIFTPKQISEMTYCIEKGITSFKIYMNLGGDVGHVYMDMAPYSSQLSEEIVDVNDKLVEEIVKTAASLGCPVLVHAEDYESCACGIKTAKEKKRDGLPAWSESRSPEFEAKAIKTVCKFGRDYNCTIYFVHIGSQKALQQITEERKLGTRIFVETCPHYLTLSYENQKGYLAKVMPPIRTVQDNAAVWDALSHNLIDTIGTDHVANQLKLKLGGTDVWGA